jgi:hypothetical protein
MAGLFDYLLSKNQAILRKDRPNTPWRLVPGSAGEVSRQPLERSGRNLRDAFCLSNDREHTKLIAEERLIR